MRKLAYGLLLKGFMTILVAHIQTELFFNSHKECIEFLKDQNAVIIKNQNIISKKIEFSVDCKESSIFSSCSIFIPLSSSTSSSSSSSSIAHTTSTTKSASIFSSNGLISKHNTNNNNNNNNNNNEKKKENENKNRKVKKIDRRGTRRITLTGISTITTSSPNDTTSSVSNVSRKIDRGDISGSNQSTESSNKRREKSSGNERKSNKKIKNK